MCTICYNVLLSICYWKRFVRCHFPNRLASYYTVRLGDHNRYVSEGTEQDITAKRVIVHPQYSSSKLDKDIALIQLSKSATLNSRVGTVCLPAQDEMVSTSARCFITGESKDHLTSLYFVAQQIRCILINFKKLFNKNSSVCMCRALANVTKPKLTLI